MPIFQCITYCNDELNDELNQRMNDSKPKNITFDATSIIDDANETGHHSNLKSTENKPHILHKKKRGRALPTMLTIHHLFNDPRRNLSRSEMVPTACCSKEILVQK
eukprot:566723_1